MDGYKAMSPLASLRSAIWVHLSLEHSASQLVHPTPSPLLSALILFAFATLEIYILSHKTEHFASAYNIVYHTSSHMTYVKTYEIHLGLRKASIRQKLDFICNPFF